ncbi:MAG: WG repeat-containing protein [Flavobacteriales bacterium]
MQIIRFLTFFCLWSFIATSQPSTLVKFTREFRGNDGLIYTLEGYRDARGKEVIPADYDFIWPFNNDTVTIARKRIITDNYLVNYYNPVFEHQLITTGGYLLHIFSPRQVPEPPSNDAVRVLDTRRNKFGFVDYEGRRIVRPIFDVAGDFNEGFAPVKRSLRKDKYYSFINKSGKIAITGQFTEAFPFSAGTAVVRINGRFHFLDQKGKITPIQDTFIEIDDFYGGFAVVSNFVDGKTQFGIVNAEGKTVIAPAYDFIDKVVDSTAVFLKDNKVGMLDLRVGKEIIPARYDGLFRFDRLHYLFEENGLQGLMSLSGDIVIPAKYHTINFFNDGVAAVRLFNKWGFVSIYGEEIIEPQYAEVISPFKSGEALVRRQDRYLLASPKDTLLLPDYDFVSDVFGKTLTYIREGKIGFLDLKGEELTGPQFDEVVINEGDIFFAKRTINDKDERWSLVNSEGRIIIVDKYLEISRYSEGYAAVKTDKGWGFIDMNGAEICAPRYDMVRNFSKGMAAVNLNGHWGFINAFGIETIPVYVEIKDFSKYEDEQGFLRRGDTLSFLRERFPLYGFEVIGDYDGQCFCVEDLSRDNFNDAPLCMNKSGKVRRSQPCTMFVKEAEEVDISRALNNNFKTIVIKGKTLRIDRAGKEIQ